MPNRSDAEEHLRIIRSLMEKATIYRAISAPTALVGGILSLAAAVVQCVVFPPTTNGGELSRLSPWFSGIWFGVLVATLGANTYFLWRGALDRQAPFLSSGMRLALRATLPGLLCAVFFSAIFGADSTLQAEGYGVFYLPPLWMLFYGVGLLATFHFAPRSITRLGWAFLAAGMGSFYLVLTEKVEAFVAPHATGMSGTHLSANLLMAATFGLFHLIYAACTWTRRPAESGSGAQP